MNTNKVSFTNESGLLESINKFQEKLIGEHKNEDQAQTACQKVSQIYDVFDTLQGSFL